ncbi:glycosyltransferase family 4 protein [Methylobacterium sp. Leaf466]|uniref:glycosyltransferase family 4 protein n=1 Tax=Methylobacterium sp. Leaf466 TaxID=1736386 RepID=UPI001AEC38E8|nr:glycosyltransferase family 4 protein [Methylobacterium sp. Leaf466]
MNSPVKVLLADAARHRKPTGYGKNARSLIRMLSKDPNIELAVQHVVNPWEIDDETRRRLGEYTECSILSAKNFDVVLHVGNPASCRKYDAPTLAFSYCDTSDLPKLFIDKLSLVDGIVAPNFSNLDIYRRNFKRVYFAQPGIDEHPFKRIERFRVEGRKEFTFIFVGSFSYRKGFDVMIEAFAQEFEPHEAHLFIHIPGDQCDAAANDIFRRSSEFGRAVNVSLSSSIISEAWMARFYNRADCLLTCTRGEGWGLPQVEAMLCELPIISPFGSAMADYLTPEVALRIDTSPLRVVDILSSMGASYKAAHGFGSNSIHEPSLESVRRQMRFAWGNREAVAKLGVAARHHILTHFSEEHFGRRMAEAIQSFHNDMQAEATSVTSAPPVDTDNLDV